MESLLNAITRLYMQISSRLLEMRMDRRPAHRCAPATADITGPLIGLVRKYAAESPPRAREQANPAEVREIGDTALGELREEGAEAGGRPPQEGDAPPGAPSELVLKFAKEPRVGSLQPPVGEQLKRRTHQYINHALELAKQGRLEAAEASARLADNALKTAAGYLSEDEYRDFQTEVMKRVAPPAEQPPQNSV